MSTAAAVLYQFYIFNVLHIVPNKAQYFPLIAFILHHPAYINVVIWSFQI